jgi:peptidoglycan/LPS O-acetylase OafA/YrhL
MATTTSLNDVLKREGNNFDLFRLIAAMAVIIGHAYALHPQPPLQDGILGILHFDYSGSLAVKFFFLLSGMLVTNSIINNPNPFQFLAKRALRIFPGLLVCLLVAVFIVGPIFTKFSLTDYFSSPETWSYVKKNLLLMDIQWRLTGVFTESSNGLNGSLWTLPFEALCYIYLAIFYGLGILKNKSVANVFLLGVIAVSIFAPSHLPAPFDRVTDSHLLPTCFAIGGLFANNKKHISINITNAALLCLLAYMLSSSNAFQFLFYIAFFYVVIFISSLPFVIKYFKLPFDASYGIYVYGYMIQQCVHVMFPNVGVHTHQLISLFIAIPLGILSWYYVEKPCIEFGKNLFKSFNWQSIKEKITNSIHRIQIYKIFIITGVAVLLIISIIWFQWRNTKVSDKTADSLKNGVTEIEKSNSMDRLITFNNLDSYSTTGFYSNEGNFRWTNGNASIAFQNGDNDLKDSLNIELEAILTPACKNVNPKILIKDENNKVYQPVAANRDGDKFFYKFYFNSPIKLQKIDISSETIDVTPPDVRILSFPFISLLLKINHS